MQTTCGLISPEKERISLSLKHTHTHSAWMAWSLRVVLGSFIAKHKLQNKTKFNGQNLDTAPYVQLFRFPI
jgi:hypothetical protein